MPGIALQTCQGLDQGLRIQEHPGHLASDTIARKSRPDPPRAARVRVRTTNNQMPRFTLNTKNNP